MEGATITILLSGLLSVIVIIAKAWEANRPKRDQETAHEQIQQGRADIANGDIDRIAARIDSLLPAAKPPAGDPAREQSAEDIERRISNL